LSPIFRLPVQIAVFDSNGKHIHEVVIDQLEQSFELPYSGTLMNVIFDNEQMLLAKVKEDKPTEQYVSQYYNGLRYKARKEGLMFGSKSKDQAGQQLIIDALNDPFWDIRLTAIEKAVKLDEANKDKGIALIRDLAMNDANSQVRSSALTFLSNNIEGEALETILVDRIDKDRSYLLVSTVFKSLVKIKP